MLLFILLFIVAIIAGVFAIAMTKPATFSVTRTLAIAAPPAKLQAMINDFHAWGAWSPWEKIDPNLQRTFSGPASGVGAVYEWKGNKSVGSGRMEVLGEESGQSVKIKLDFITPFEGHNITTFSFVPAGANTTVRWEMNGPNTMIGKVMSVFISMDAMIGKDFEKGLANMKAAAEV
jgi:hypothetical protein